MKERVIKFLMERQGHTASSEQMCKALNVAQNSLGAMLFNHKDTFERIGHGLYKLKVPAVKVTEIKDLGNAILRRTSFQADSNTAAASAKV